VAEPPSFFAWLMGLPWWAKVLIFGGTALGVYLSVFMPL